LTFPPIDSSEYVVTDYPPPETSPGADRAEIIRLLREQNEMFQRIEKAVLEVYTEMNVMLSRVMSKQ